MPKSEAKYSSKIKTVSPYANAPRESHQSYSPFCEELCTAFLCADILLSKLDHSELCEFLKNTQADLLPFLPR
ncbi:hypothetical protein ANN_17739 [Periplaneta americana]|uniref:Uncharacterized protein n=1 Tax=Periplaneta americana TaxID=6978 RepID=A0ABQ8STT4_PERAM|nr:hypothetical protein ANN_17739 [Periplaneta americana]